MKKIFLLFLFILFFTSCENNSNIIENKINKENTNLKNKSLCSYEKISEKYDDINTISSFNGSKGYYFIAKKGGKEFIVKNGIEFKEYDRILSKIYENGEDIAYVAEKEGKMIFIKNNNEIKSFDKISYFTISPNFDKIAYAINNNGVYSINDNGNIFGKYDSVGYLKYSPNSNELIFVGEKDGKRFIVKNGIEGKKYEYVSNPEYSKNGKDFSYIAFNEGKDFIVKNGIEGKKYDLIKEFSQEYTLDGKKFMYIVKNDEKFFIVENGIEGKKYENIKNNLYSDITNKLTYIAEKNGKSFIVENGIEGEKFNDELLLLDKSTNGEKIFYRTYNLGSPFKIMINRKIIGDYNKYDTPLISKFSKDTIDYAINLRTEEGEIIKNGKKILLEEYENFFGLAFIKNNQLIFGGKKEGKWELIKEKCK